MWTRVAAFAFVRFALIAACAGRPAQTTRSYDNHLGLVIALGNASCFTTKARSLAPRTPLHVVDPGSTQHRQAIIVASANSCLDGSAQGSGLQGYTIQFDHPPPQTPFYGIGLVGASPQFRTLDGTVAADVDGDGRDEFFRSCTSAEGVHFTIWSDATLAGSRLWHRYQPLGYDVSPTCTSAETTGS